jgi:outer membrane protein assembly factor BamB
MTQMQISPSEVLVVGTRGYLLAFEKDTGKPIWKYEFEKSTWATGSGYVSTLVSGDKLFAGCYGEIYCFDLLKGSLLWRDNLKGKGFGVVSFAVLGASTNPMPGAEVDRQQHNEEQPS